MSIFCSTCGSKNEGGAKFCDVCGTKLPLVDTSIPSDSSPSDEKGGIHKIRNNSHTKQNHTRTHDDGVTPAVASRTRKYCLSRSEESYTDDTKILYTDDNSKMQQPQYNNTTEDIYSHAPTEKSGISLVLLFAIVAFVITLGIIAANALGWVHLFGKTDNTKDIVITADTNTHLTDLYKDTSGFAQGYLRDGPSYDHLTDDDTTTDTSSTQQPQPSIDERAEIFIRQHYNMMGSGQAYIAWDNYAPEFIRDCEKNKKPSLCSREKFANLWGNTRGIDILNFQKIGYLNYKYTVKVYGSSGNTNYYITEIKLYEIDNNGFLITWYNAS